MKPRHPSNRESDESVSSYKTSDRRRVTPDAGGSSRSHSEKESEHTIHDPYRGHTADKPSEVPKTGWKDILWRTKEAMKENNLSIVSAGVAFYIFLGIIPALGALVSIWGLAAEPSTIQQQVDSMSGMLPAQVVEIVDNEMTRIASQKTGALLGTIVGILLAIWSGAKAMKTLMSALNITYEEDETRGFIRLNLAAFLLTLGGILGFILAIGIIVALPKAMAFVGLGSTAAALVKVVRWPLLAMFAIMGLGVLYRYGPDRHPARWRWISPGAIVATLVWIAISAGFSFYVANFGNYNKTYGALGAVVIVLLWFLITAYVVLFGAELNAQMERQTAHDTTKRPEQPQGHRGAYVADNLGEEKRN